MSDQDGNIVLVNAAFCDISGYSADEIVGTSVSRLIHSDDIESVRRTVKRVIDNPGGYEQNDYRRIGKSGNIVWTRARVSMAIKSEGNPTYFVAHVEDITERKRARNWIALRARQLPFSSKSPMKELGYVRINPQCYSRPSFKRILPRRANTAVPVKPIDLGHLLRQMKLHQILE